MEQAQGPLPLQALAIGAQGRVVDQQIRSGAPLGLRQQQLSLLPVPRLLLSTSLDSTPDPRLALDYMCRRSGINN